MKPTDKAPREYLKYTTVAFQMAALIGLCAYVGDLIDSCYQHATPWVTVLGCIIGVALSIYQVIRTLK